MSEPRDLTIGEAVAGMRAGNLTAEALVASCLERIRSRDTKVRAWVEVYADAAIMEARVCDREAGHGRWRGPLHGIPLGVKDIIHVRGMWTRAGTPVYPAHVADDDAPAVARLRRAGAIFLGKTETTPFANNDPTVTRNPWNLDHTPGGSSSGSAAAVADRMCPAALGTQTGGSLLRPAAYTGIVGFKATYGRVSTDGVIPNSWSLDHVGVLTRCVTDAAILWACLREDGHHPFARMPEPPRARRARPPASGPRLGYIRQFFESEVSGAALENLSAVRERFRSAGADVVELPLPPSFGHVISAWDIIKQAELYAFHRPFFEARHDEYPPKLRARLDKGAQIPGHVYATHLQHRMTFQREMDERMTDVDAVFMPVASNTAPCGLSSTGSSYFNRPWTVSGFPAMSLPTNLDPNGLPFGIQIAAQPYAEERLLDVAGWCERVLAFSVRPPAADGSPDASRFGP